MTPTHTGRSYTLTLLLLSLFLLLSCGDEKAGGSATDVDTMVGTVVNLSKNPVAGIRAFCYSPDYLPYENDTALYESIEPSNTDGEYTFTNFAADTSYNIITMDENKHLAGFRRVSKDDFTISPGNRTGSINGEDTVRNIESDIPRIYFNTSIPLVMQVKGTPFYTALDKPGYFDQSIPHGMYDFHLSFPNNPELNTIVYDDIPVPFVNGGIITLTIPDTIPPSVIDSAYRTELTHSTIAYDWVPSKDNSSLAGYEIEYYPKGSPDLAETLYTAYSQIRITNLEKGTIYALRGRSKDLLGNYSEWIGPYYDTTDHIKDEMGPIISDAYVTYATQTSVTIEWSAGVDVSPISEYHFRYYEAELPETVKTVTIPHRNDITLYNNEIDSLKPNTRYTVEISGVDTHGNESFEPKKVYAKTYK